jgi:hypothetical protein
MTLTLAIDPGVTTGIALRMPGSLFTTEVEDETDLFRLVIMATEVVYENYAGQIISKYGLHTVRLVGGIIALCWRERIQVTRHVPTDRLPFMRDAKKILVGRGEKYSQHELDSLAHLLRYEYDKTVKVRDKV